MYTKIFDLPYEFLHSRPRYRSFSTFSKTFTSCFFTNSPSKDPKVLISFLSFKSSSSSFTFVLNNPPVLSAHLVVAGTMNKGTLFLEIFSPSTASDDRRDSLNILTIIVFLCWSESDQMLTNYNNIMRCISDYNKLLLLMSSVVTPRDSDVDNSKF